MSDAPRGRRAQLERLAVAYDVQPQYEDLDKQVIEAKSESLLAVLKAMGAIQEASDVPDALAEKERRDWAWSLPPVLLAWAGLLSDVSLRVPAASRSAPSRWHILLEDGAELVQDIDLAKTRVSSKAGIDGDNWVQLGVTLDGALPHGYHRLAVELGDRRLESLIVAAPRHAYRGPERRSWGVFLPLYAMHSRRSWGIGDYSDLTRLLEWTQSQGGQFVGTLPLLPAFMDEPAQPSPYEPVSRLFWNEIYVDVEAPIEGVSPPVDASLAAEARALNETPEVPYAAVMQVKRRQLVAQAEALKNEPAVAQGLEGFLERRPQVGDYAAFRAAVERLGRDWRFWPEDARAGRLQHADYDAAVARYYEFAQWRAESQMQAAADRARDLDARLYLDLPIGVGKTGYDAWRYRNLYAQAMSAGAPPDLLSSNGQDWGFQPLIPNVLRASGYEYLIEHLRHCLSAATMVRIDHAIGLHRLYWIPEGATGRDGVFVRQPAEELYAVLCLESERAQAVLIGEDLGLVPPEVESGLESHRLNRMHVQLFEMTGEARQPLNPAPELSIASFSTHDLPPFAAYWQDEDLEHRRSLGLLTPERVEEQKESRDRDREALVEHLHQRGVITDADDVASVYRGSVALQAESRADWLVLNIEDTWGETRSQNLPGTTDDQHPNWLARAAHALDDFDAIEGVRETIRTVRDHRGVPNPEGD